MEKLRIVTRSLFYRSSNEWPSFEGANRKLKYSLKRGESFLRFVRFLFASYKNIVDYLTIFRSNNVNIQFTEYTRANSICPRENCLDSTKCEHFVVGATCPRSSDTCCSIGKFVQNVIINEESWKYLFFVNRIHF